MIDSSEVIQSLREAPPFLRILISVAIAVPLAILVYYIFFDLRHRKNVRRFITYQKRFESQCRHDDQPINLSYKPHRFLLDRLKTIGVLMIIAVLFVISFLSMGAVIDLVDMSKKVQRLLLMVPAALAFFCSLTVGLVLFYLAWKAFRKIRYTIRNSLLPHIRVKRIYRPRR